MPRAMLGLWRLLRALLHALGGYWTIRSAFPRMDAAGRARTVEAWARRMLQILGVALQVEGGLPLHGPLLIVANHISWLDILVLHATRHCRFVAKADIAGWPLIGTLATGAGTLYIERASRRDASRMVRTMAERLRAGDLLAVFPEGTTSDGTGLLPFHANLLQSAVSGGAPVQPVALDYVDDASGQTTLAASYADDTNLLQSLWRTVSAPPLRAVVRVGVPQMAMGRDRRALAQEMEQAVAVLRSGFLR